MPTSTLELCDGLIRYRVDNSPVWEMPIADARVIGEMTNDHGPLLDDYFICFATDANIWYEASFYADGRDEFLKSTSAFLGCELPLSLAGSTIFQSNVLWPPHLAGKPMFRFIPKRPKAWLCRLLGLSSNIQCFTDEVLSELKSQGQADR